MKPLISVIIPVYNVEQYVARCVQSVMTQTYEHLQIIIIDDGSTDRSGEICEELSGKDHRIELIHQKNQGLSAARNKGLRKALGQFICFIDSDDYIKPDFLMKLWNLISGEDFGIAFCNMESDKLGAKHDNAFFEEILRSDRVSFSSVEAALWLSDVRGKEHGIMVMMMNKLFSKRLFEGITFPEGKLHEDAFVIYELLMRAEKISFCREELYCYTTREDSITGKKQEFDIRHLDLLEAYLVRMEQCYQHQDQINYEMTWRNYLNQSYLFYKKYRYVDKKIAKQIAENYISVLKSCRMNVCRKRYLKYRILGLWVSSFNG